MIKNVNVLNSHRKTIDKFTAKIGSAPTYKDYLDGVQVNWAANGKSFMWRSNIPDKVEIYTGDDYNIHYLYLDEI